MICAVQPKGRAVPDARKSLRALNEAWSQCTRCELGERRLASGGSFVAGEGSRRGIMLVGEGPGKEEEISGSPFVGPSGRLLRKVITKLGLTDYYITNLVACRSCSPVTNPDGTPRFWKSRRGGPMRPMMKDEPPLPSHIMACSERFYEELYIVDPILVVSLGGKACEMLTKGPATILKQRGQLSTIEIPGASTRAVLTEKKGVWVRKVKGQLAMPVEPNQVEYMLLPTLHPAYVLRKLRDQHADNSPLAQLVADLRLAVKIYERYLLEAFNREPTGMSDTPDEEITADEYEEEDGEEPPPDMM